MTAIGFKVDLFDKADLAYAAAVEFDYLMEKFK